MTEQKTDKYTVLARKYRPQTFKDLVGQDALVQTLTNAIEQDRIAHAYLLTGIRGVGKTSTARIIAKALTCIGEDGKGQATPDPCGMCEHCIAITESRHVDVLEMDAASRTGVNDIREIIENANYLPSSARHKIYIIDEVHMLSKSAFNALLKTLEEPPEHVRFIFATTEVRKIPVTILSRCQRFDLPRVGTELLATHLLDISAGEGVQTNAETMSIIAKAAEGSVRDALSLLDQAIAHGGSQKKIEFEQVAKMLGLLGKDKLINLFSDIAKSDIKSAIEKLREMYSDGADPVAILQDLLELSHVLTQIKVIPDLTDTQNYSKDDLSSAKKVAEKLEFPFLARVWQMLVKGIQEAALATNSLMATEMILIRITYASSLPTPGDLIKKIQEGSEAIANPAPGTPSPSEMPNGVPIQTVENPQNFDSMIELFKINGEPFLYNWLQNEVHLVKFEDGHLEIRVTEAAPRDLPGRIMSSLQKWTGSRWSVVVSNEAGEATIKEKKIEQLDEKKAEATKDRDVVAILKVFPGSEIVDISEIIEGNVSEESESNNDKKIKSGEV